MGCEICTHLKKLRYPFTLQGSPHFNIIHCSDENLEQITMSKLVAQNQVGYQTHTSFPEFPLTFFFISANCTRGEVLWNRLKTMSICWL